MISADAGTTSLIRPMRDTDVIAALEIEQLVNPNGWSDGIFRDCLRVGYSCWVMERLDLVIGYAIMSVATGEAHILNVAIDRRYQREGHGSRFVCHLLDLARNHCAETVFLEVRPSNRVALAVYYSLGFRQVGMRRNYYQTDDGKEDAVIMACTL